jgi:hypothetical protein
MSASPKPRLTEPWIIWLALAAAAAMVLCILAILDTGAIWIAVLTVVTVAFIGLAIVYEMRRVIGATGSDDPDPPAPPGRAVFVCTSPMTADQVLRSLDATGAEHRSVMVVAPEGLGSHGLKVDERDYDRARRAEGATVAALRKAGINATGHVGDRNPEHAITDALALFPATDVVVVAHAAEREAYDRHLDCAALKRRTGADVRVLDAIET